MICCEAVDILVVALQRKVSEVALLATSHTQLHEISLVIQQCLIGINRQGWYRGLIPECYTGRVRPRDTGAVEQLVRSVNNFKTCKDAYIIRAAKIGPGIRDRCIPNEAHIWELANPTRLPIILSKLHRTDACNSSCNLQVRHPSRNCPSILRFLRLVELPDI